MSAEDSARLQKLCKGKSGKDQIKYKEALQFMSPNYDLVDPMGALWSVRQPGPSDRSLGASSSRGSLLSKSPSMVSMRSLNNLHSPLKKGNLGQNDLNRSPSNA